MRYSLTLYDNYIHIRYGIQNGSWGGKEGSKSWCKQFPWVEEDRTKCLILNEDGSQFANVSDLPNGRIDFKSLEAARNAVKKTVIQFRDFDGTIIEAQCHKTYAEYRRGTGLFKFLRLFLKKKIYINLEVLYNHEIGEDKGSWKGGTCGESFPCSRDEKAIDVFKRIANDKHYTKNCGYVSRRFTDITELTK
jgi:hypothetical protein